MRNRLLWVLAFILVVLGFGIAQNGQVVTQGALFQNLTFSGVLQDSGGVTLINDSAITGFDFASRYGNFNSLTDSGTAGFNIYATYVGTVIPSAATITIVKGLTHISGTTAIATINAPIPNHDSGYTGCVDFIADGAWTTVLTGNIANAITAVASTNYRACFDGTKWYIK